MSAAATPFTASIADDGGTDDLVEASRGIPLQCAPGVVLHGLLAGAPCVTARVLRGGVLRRQRQIIVDIWAVLNQTRTRLIDFDDVGRLTVDQTNVIKDVIGELRGAGVRVTAEVSGQTQPHLLEVFDVVRVVIVPDLRVAELPRPSTLAAAHEIRALVRSEGDLKSLESIIATAPVRVGDGPDRCVVTLDLAFAGYPADERALYELAKAAAFKHGWRLSPNAPQPRRSF